MEFNVSITNRFALFEDEPDSAIVEEPVKPVKKSAKGQAGKGKGNMKKTSKKVVTAPKSVVEPPVKSVVVLQQPPRPPTQRYNKPDIEQKRPQRQRQKTKPPSAAPVEVTNFPEKLPPVNEESKEDVDKTMKEIDANDEEAAPEVEKVLEKRNYAEYKASLKVVEHKFNVRMACDGVEQVFKKLTPIKRNEDLHPVKKPERETRVKTNRKAREMPVDLPPGELFQLPRRGHFKRNDDHGRRPYHADNGASPQQEHPGCRGYGPPDSGRRGDGPRGGGFRGRLRRGGGPGRFHDDNAGANRGERPHPRGGGGGGNFRGGGGLSHRGRRGGGMDGDAPLPTFDSPSGFPQPAVVAAAIVDDDGW